MTPLHPVSPQRFRDMDIHHRGPTIWIGSMGYSIQEAEEYAVTLPKVERESFESALKAIVEQYQQEHALVEQREFTL